MTENEVIERIKEHMEIHKLNELRAFYITEAFDIAVTALKEIQQYREIGTVKECRGAVEKQKAKKSVLRSDNGRLRKSCPVCGCFFSPSSRHCPKCGQRLSESEE